MKQSRLSNIAYRQQRCDWAVRLGPGVIGPLGPVYLPSPWPPPEGGGITVHCLGIFVLFDPAAFYSDGLRIVPVAQICLSRLRTLRQAQDVPFDKLRMAGSIGWESGGVRLAPGAIGLLGRYSPSL